MNEQVNEYYRYLDAIEEEACNEQMRQAEGNWEDGGCSWVSAY